MSLIHRKFNLMISPGTIYLALYSLEREGLIKSKTNDNTRKRVYVLTFKGEEFIERILSMQENIKMLISKIFCERGYLTCKSNLTKT